MKYSTVIKAIIGGATAIGTIVATNLFSKEQKVDKTADDVSEIKKRLNGIGVQGETIDIDWSDGVAASDQDVDNAV